METYPVIPAEAVEDIKHAESCCAGTGRIHVYCCCKIKARK